MDDMRAPPELAAPEPGLKPEEMIARARGMRAILRERQDACEAAGEILPETQRDFLAAGFYRIVQPRRFGGYEFDVPTFLKVMMEIARGCPSSGWVLALTAGHPLLLAVFSDQAQIEAYGADGDFRSPAVGQPVVAVPCEGGFRLDGGWDYASGCDLATHLLGGAILPNPSRPPTHLHVLLRRQDFSVHDNWRMIGMQGTGSRRAILDKLFVPSHRTVHWGLWEDPPLRPPGRRLLANPLYHGRKPTFLIAEATAVAVGIARGALDCYEELLRTKPVNLPAMALRSQSQEYQEYFGTAHAWIDTAEGALLQVGRDYTMACEQASAGVPFTDETDRRLILVLQQCVKLAWDATDLLFTTAGTSGGRRDSKLARYFRDLAVLRTHGTMRQGRTAPNFARLHFGLPPLSPI